MRLTSGGSDIASPEPPVADAARLDPELEQARTEDRGAALRREARSRRRDAIFRRLLIASDVSAVMGALLGSALLFGEDQLTVVTVIAPIIVVLSAKVTGLYDRDEHVLHKTTLDEVPALFAIACFSVLMLLFADDVVVEGTIGERQIFGTFVLFCGLLVSLRGVARWLGRMLTPPERCVLAGNTSRQLELLDAIRFSPATHAEIVGSVAIPAGGTSAARQQRVLDAQLDAYDADRVIVFPGSQGYQDLMFAIRELRGAGAKVSIMPDLTRLIGTSFAPDSISGITLMGMRRFAITRSSRLIKRSFDLTVASAIVIALSPVLLVTAIAIRLDSRGPAIFSQERIGRSGQRFRIHKFRSMRVGSEHRRDELQGMNQAAPGLFKIAEDPRLTKVGRWIRRTSIDELPQLFDVLGGTMSLVGPRPLVPEEDELIVGRYRERLDLPPGITGHWQVLGSFRISTEEMVKLDYLYVANWSLWNDIVLLMRTIPVVLRRRGI